MPVEDDLPDQEYLNSFGMALSIHTVLTKSRLMLTDTYIEVRGSCLIASTFYNKTDRKKLKRDSYQVVALNKGKRKTTKTWLTDEDINQALNQLKFKRERAVGNEFVSRKNLVNLMKEINQILINARANERREEKQNSYPYKTVTARAKLIANLLKWAFHIKYNRAATYQPEQIRKFI